VSDRAIIRQAEPDVGDFIAIVGRGTINDARHEHL